MPIYEYHCGKCGDFEVMQKMSDKALSTCPTCRRKVTKLISSTSFQLKGSGWYVTDYARKGGGGGETKSSGGKSEDKSSKSEDKSAKAEDKKSDTSSESKSENKSESKPKKGGSEKAAAA